MRLFGLIGRPLGHSWSAKYFGEKFRREGIDARYELFELERIEDIASLPPEIGGFNVTIPYKQAVIPYLDALSPEAQAAGAVNCVVCRNGRRTGHNTDIAGIRATLDMLAAGEDTGRALILGTGGASAAVQYVLAERGVPFELVSRDPARGNLTYEMLTTEMLRDYRLIVNATPAGMHPNTDDEPPIPYEGLNSGHMLFDLIYNPPLTRFLQHGAEAHALTAGGQTMFVAQAEASWRLWNGKD